MRRILLMALTVLISLSSWAQNRTVTGKVTSAEDGSPLPGVNVVLKGTSVGTVTDVDGKYTIGVGSEGGTLVFSFIGLQTTEVSVGSRNTVDVSLNADVTQLSEVVVTGYGTGAVKRELTGSISSVKGSTIEALPLQTFDRAIQGRLAGVQVGSASGQPGGAINVRVRGIGSVNAGTRPLYIVDGVQVNTGGISTQASSNALGGINPADIEAIEVLKDASATAIYGAQGANGVVVITTKRGKSGKPVINVNIQEGIVQPLNYYEMMNSRQLAELKIEAYENNPNSGGRAAAIALYGDPEDPDLINYDWADALFRNAKLKQYDLNLSGGDEKTKYYISGAYNLQEGQITGSQWERITTRANITSKASDKLTVGLNLSLAYQESNGVISDGNFVNGAFSAVFGMRPNVPGIDPETGKFTDYGALSGGHNFGYNILQGVAEEVRLSKTYSAITNLSLSYNILPNLKATGFAGINIDINRDQNNRPATIPAFAGTGGSALLADRRFVNFNTNAVLEYNKTFNSVHKVSALAGYEFKSETRDQFSASANQFSDPSFLLLSSGVPSGATGVFTEYARTGIFGQVKYDYNDKYTAEVTVRRDGSSRFTPDNRFGTFYAGSVAWRISSESFMSSTSGWLDNLKLRGSFGTTGNSEINNFDWNQAFQTTAVAGRYLNAATTRLNRPLGVALGWETSVQTNIGLDFGFLSGKFSGSIDLWNRDNNDLLFNRQLPVDSGFGAVFANVGSMNNRGIDIELNANILDINGFRWNVVFNNTFQDNEVTELPDGADRIGTTIFKGKSIQALYGVRYAGANPANGRPMFYDANGNLTYTATNADQTFIGDGFVRYFGGLANNFSYKGISLEVFFQYQGGNDVFNADSYNLESAGYFGENQRTTQLDRWQQPGDISPNPRAYEGDEPNGSGLYGFFTDRIISDGSYVRLKQVTLSYNIPQRILQKAKITNARVFVQGLNLATFTKFNGIDPEVINEAASSYGTFPNGRQYTVGVSLTF